MFETYADWQRKKGPLTWGKGNSSWLGQRLSSYIRIEKGLYYPATKDFG